MARVCFIGIVCLATAAVAAETAPPAETLFDGAVVIGGYGAPAVRVGQFNGDVAAFAGVQGGVILNHTLVLGAGGWGLIPSVNVADGAPRWVNFGYGGFLVEYTPFWHKLVHPHASVLIGGGGLSYSDTYGWEYGYVDVVFIVEPTVGVELNLTKYLRLAVGGGYRYAADTEFEGLTDDDLRGVSGAAVFKIGAF
jgi:hypothetical protein